MSDKRGSGHSGDIQNDIEEAIEDKRRGVLAADDTGMIGNEELITDAELREGDVTPPA
jgi:hypothetical protein